jgi:hypothetical protein
MQRDQGGPWRFNLTRSGAPREYRGTYLTGPTERAKGGFGSRSYLVSASRCAQPRSNRWERGRGASIATRGGAPEVHRHSVVCIQTQGPNAQGAECESPVDLAQLPKRY